MDSFHNLSAEDVIATLDLSPHPEGGHFREIHRHSAPDGGRGAVTSIYFLLAADEQSHWHRVLDADEIWCWHAGAPLQLRIQAEGRPRETHVLGMDLGADQRPQAVVPTNAWQAAPAFDFAQFVLAEPDFEPA